MKFYDTNALLDLQEEAFEEPFAISSVTLEELEDIKTSSRKDPAVKYLARKLIHLLDENEDKYQVVVYDGELRDFLRIKGCDETPDNKICACARKMYPVEFITGDIACRTIAREVFKLNVQKVGNRDLTPYKGYKEVKMNDEQIAELYTYPGENIMGLLTNQYLIVRNEAGELVDKFRWTDKGLVPVTVKSFKSNMMGEIKPYKGDVYQQLVVDSFLHNQITMVRGPAGTGKTLLSLSYMFSLIDKHQISKIVMFCNTPKTANSVGLGFYPGSKDAKLLDSSIGNMLASKLGGRSYMVEQLIAQNQIELLPLSDLRGYDTSNMNCAVYITEAQNLDIELMKLALQRIGEDSICIIDGDYNTQIDLAQYAGINNGMRRASEVFRGTDLYGEVELKNIYRARIADIAEKM